jgi:hypothetical protein
MNLLNKDVLDGRKSDFSSWSDDELRVWVVKRWGWKKVELSRDGSLIGYPPPPEKYLHGVADWTESGSNALDYLIPFHWAVSIRRLRGGDKPDIWHCTLTVGSINVYVEHERLGRALTEAYCIAVEAGAEPH